MRKEFVIRNKFGLHARPAKMLVEEASRFKSAIFLLKDDMEINAKSIMGVLQLAAARGTRLVVRAEGPDESLAVEALGRLFADGFGEP